MSSLYPLRFDADLREKIWGSTDLRPFYGRKGKPVGEAWFSFEENVVANGELEGDTHVARLRQLGILPPARDERAPKSPPTIDSHTLSALPVLGLAFIRCLARAWRRR